MAHITPYGTFQICIRNRLLPKALWATFDTEEQAANYAAQREGLLAQGVAPATLLERSTPSREVWTVIAAYQPRHLRRQWLH